MKSPLLLLLYYFWKYNNQLQYYCYMAAESSPSGTHEDVLPNTVGLPLKGEELSSE